MQAAAQISIFIPGLLLYLFVWRSLFSVVLWHKDDSGLFYPVQPEWPDGMGYLHT